MTTGKLAYRINHHIRATEVRVVGITGEQLGIMNLDEALKLSKDAGIDLIEVAPQAKPPVCRLMDYGKFKYQEQKKAHEAKLKQKVIAIKEVKFRPSTDEGDYTVKLKSLIRFLEEGDKARVVVKFKGREIAYQEIGLRVLERLRVDLEDYAQIEQMPKMEGRQAVMLLGPKKK